MSTENLWSEIEQGNAGAVQQAIRTGADVNCVSRYDGYDTPLTAACAWGHDRIIRILLDAGANARWYSPYHGIVSSAIVKAFSKNQHFSTVQLLLQHDNSLLELADGNGMTALMYAADRGLSEIVQFLLHKGANIYAATHGGVTALIFPCMRNNLEMVRLLLAADVELLEARTRRQETALHFAAQCYRVEAARELILRHNAKMFVVDIDGETPFDWACRTESLEQPAGIADFFLEIYGNKMTAEHGRLALHFILGVAKYSFASLNQLRIVLPLGKLTLKHFRTLISTLDTELIRNRGDSGKLPIHIACQTNAPVDVLSVLVELDSVTLQIANDAGMLPIHVLCGCSGAAADYARVRYLVEQGGVGTLTARTIQGELPLHVLCASTHPPLPTVQYLIQSFPGSVAVRANAGDYPFMMAASKASLSVVYELVRVNPDLVVSR